jgi:hypothetical protein
LGHNSGLRGWIRFRIWIGCSGRSGSSSGFAQNFKHYGSAGRTFALNGFPAILHGLFNAIGDGLFGLALDAISFRHKKFAVDASCIERFAQATYKHLQRQFQTQQQHNQQLII